MKKAFLMLVLSLAALSVNAVAGTITTDCTLFPVTFANGIGGPTNVSCAGFTPALGTLIGVTLNLFADYQFGSTGANDIKVSFAVGAPAGVTWDNAAPIIDVTGGISSTAPLIPVADNATAGITNANFASAFNVGVSSAVVTGSAATSSGPVTFTYNYTSPTPEPATLSMMGLGLLGLGVIGRKLKV